MHAALEALMFPAALVTLALLVLLGGSPALVAAAALLVVAVVAGVDRLHRHLDARDHALPRGHAGRGAAAAH